MKKVYIAGAIDGTNGLYFDFYEKLAKAIKYETILPHLLTKHIDLNSETASDEIYKICENNYRDCDIVLAYIGHPSLGVDMELAFTAINSAKKVVVFYEKKSVKKHYVIGFLKKMQRQIVEISDIGDKGIAEISAIINTL